MTRVALSDEEMLFCANAGAARLINALSARRTGAHGFNRDHERWQIDIEGVATELAAAKALGLTYTPTVGELDSATGDIGPGLQVRGTKYGTGSLLVHDRDDDDHLFILVTGIYGNYDVRGWIRAADGKDRTLWKEYKGRGAYWVPQKRLHPLDKLEVPV